MASRPPLGSGARFAALQAKLAARPGVTNPAALSAYIGRKSLGKSRFQALAAQGRKRKKHRKRHALPPAFLNQGKR
jgi:hypothetical protein